VDVTAVDELNATFAECGAFFRDTTLPEAVLGRYRVGVLLREPTYCDASHRAGGFVAPHRYVIFSSHAKSLHALEPEPWGLCAWAPSRRLKVIDVVGDGEHTQITLLEIPEHLLEWFATPGPNPIEQSFAGHGRELFAQLRAAAPVPILDTDHWRDRLVFPVGVDDQGWPYPLYVDDEHASDEARPRIARVLRYLAAAHLQAGAYSEADLVLREAVTAQRPFADRDPESLASLLVALADLRAELGDADEAERDLHEAFTLFKRLEHDRAAVARVLLRLGHLYQRRGQPEAAERNYLHALKIVRRVEGERSPGAATILTSLGALYEAWGRWDEAAAHLNEGMEIEREVEGAEHSQSLNNLARLQQALGHFDDALATFERAGKADDAHAADELDGLVLQANVAEVLAARGDSDAAFERLTQVVAAQRRAIDDLAALGSERATLELLGSVRHRVDQCLSLALAGGGDVAARRRRAVELVLDRKGLGADLLSRRRDAVLSARHPELRERLDALTAVRVRLAQRRLAGPEHESREAFDQALLDEQRLVEELESELARAIPELSARQAERRGGLTAVAEAAPADAAVIELLRYTPFDFDAVRANGDRPWRDDRYLAVVLPPGRAGEPTLVDLADASLVDGLVADVRAAVTGGPDLGAHETRDFLQPVAPPLTGADGAAAQLREAAVDPLLGYIGGASRLVLAPDGDLLRLPFELLPAPDGTHLAERFTISYLSAARDLVRLAEPARPGTAPALVVAAPDYDAGPAAGDAAGRPFAPLPGTAVEGERIAAMLAVRPLVGDEAVKSALFDAGAPRIVHIATHGFVLREKRAPLKVDELQIGATIRSADPGPSLMALDGILATPVEFELAEDDPFERLSGRDLDNPLLRSGLAFAGANTWLRGAEAPEAAGNGVLTAEEVTGLDLGGTELVVLSACESGLGEIEPGEGILGLRRAFLLAGAKTLVISLWNIPDEQTVELMEDLHARLAAGRPRAEALREAQAAMRASHPEPFFWAAFICLGGDGPLDAAGT
jgi:tetratricopeptide (TPR) repeat protein